MSDETLSYEARAAIRAAIAWRGENRGKLLARCPRAGTPAAAAWQALVTAWNPYRASVGAIIMLPADLRRIYHEVLTWADAHPQLRGLDRDRAFLEAVGVW